VFDELGPGDEESGESENKSDDSSANKHMLCKETSKFDDKTQLHEYSAHPILVDLHLSSDQRRRRHAGNENIQDLTTNLESLTVQSEFGFPAVMTHHNKRCLPIHSSSRIGEKHHHNLSYYGSYGTKHLENSDKPAIPNHQWNCNKNQDLEVSDHPHVYQNTLQVLQHPDSHPISFLSNSSRRNSISGSENLSKTTALFCDFGDFNTQELPTNDNRENPIENNIDASFLNIDPSSVVQNTPVIGSSANGGHISSKIELLSTHNSVTEMPFCSPPSIFIRNTPNDILSLSTNSESHSNAQTCSTDDTVELTELIGWVRLYPW
jgi:hypothetical protein